MLPKLMVSSLLIAFLTSSSVANADQDDSGKKKQSCMAQVSLARTIVKYRLSGDTKQKQLDIIKKAAANDTIASVTTAIINLVYSLKVDDLDLVPGVVYMECMH